MEDGKPCIAELPAEARGMHPCVYVDAEKAELGAS